MQPGRHIVAYFDFDGTLTTRDTLVPFLLFSVGYWRFIVNLPRLIPIVLAYWCRLISNEEAKERTLTILLAGCPVEEIEVSAKNFALTRLNKYLKPEIYAKLEWHREHGHTLCLVSANLAIYLRYFTKLHKIDHLIATEIEVTPRGLVTGKLATRNCYGNEKVLRIEAYLNHHQLSFSYSYAYGNSAGDYAMLKYANEPFMVYGTVLERYEIDQEA